MESQSSSKGNIDCIMCEGEDVCSCDFMAEFFPLARADKDEDTEQHICDTCQERFNSSWSLYLHKKIHFTMDIYKCHFCESSYIDKSILIEHIKIIHNMKNYVKCEKIYMCFFCDKFLSKVPTILK